MPTSSPEDNDTDETMDEAVDDESAPSPTSVHVGITLEEPHEDQRYNLQLLEEHRLGRNKYPVTRRTTTPS